MSNSFDDSFDDHFDNAFDSYMKTYQVVRDIIVETGLVPENSKELAKYTIKGLGYLIDYRHIWLKPEGYELENEIFLHSALNFVRDEVIDDIKHSGEPGYDDDFEERRLGSFTNQESVDFFLERCNLEDEKIIIKALGRGYPLKRVARAVSVPPEYVLNLLFELKKQ
ncbi:hypothetical protein [Xylocopilactobacillus apicola]|uniref:Uncharacterized protein n=1 Tax=Xylocopilactobacillus apicola TaxID=2932184 RepID=A0AAU9DQZ9_9LACO|nr:hypothetical protein [Xylocopilactobacillus apicola]BDR57563.1 hypothetical protein XA3_00040 [Xylocopilactobacillus apicola]